MKGRDLEWMEEIRDGFVSRQSNQFLLTGNISDLNYFVNSGNGKENEETPYLLLSEFLTKRFSKSNRLLITYNVAHGLRFQEAKDRDLACKMYLSLFPANEKKKGQQSFYDLLSTGSTYIYSSLLFLQKLYLATLEFGSSQGVSLGIIIEHAEAILPNIPNIQMGDSDRQRLIFFKEWLTEERFVRSNHLILFISATASEVNESIRSLPHLTHVTIPLPNESERLRFIRWRLKLDKGLNLEGSQKSFAQLSAGMTLLHIQQMMFLAQYKKHPLSHSDFTKQLNRLLVNQIGDYIEIIKPGHSMKQVIGNAALKNQLNRLRKALESSQRKEIAPTGILVAGPNGVGKTFIVLAWAGECKRTVLLLKNLRSSYFGETDQIFEKVRNVLQVLGNVVIIIDEADTVFSKPGKNTHATEQRLFGNVIKMMGDPKNRSRIIWILLTARPQNLAPDFKRSGRCGLHLPVFNPEGKDRMEFINIMLAKSGLSLNDFDQQQKKQFMELTTNYSPADFREMVSELRTEAITCNTKLSPAKALGVLVDFIPGDVSVSRRRQTMQAFMHCSRKSLLPPSMRNLSKIEVVKELAVLQTQPIEI